MFIRETNLQPTLLRLYSVMAHSTQASLGIGAPSRAGESQDLQVKRPTQDQDKVHPVRRSGIEP